MVKGLLVVLEGEADRLERKTPAREKITVE